VVPADFRFSTERREPAGIVSTLDLAAAISGAAEGIDETIRPR
jgi:hypothetical protein